MNQGFWEKLPRPYMALAPMEGVTDTVFRRSISVLGRPDVLYTEFTNVNGICSEGFEKVSARLKFYPDEKPIVAQIWGTEPQIFFEAAKIIAEMGFDGIDINFGCPVKDVTKIGGGSRMIEKDNWHKAEEIIAATREGGRLPVSVKTRIGYKHLNTEEWADFLLKQKLAEITFHLRTAAQESKVPAMWEEMKTIVKLRLQTKSETLICGNGDVKSRSEAMDLCSKYEIDGIMVGRGVFENPAIFSTAERQLSKQERLEALVSHARAYEKEWQGIKPFWEMRKCVKMYVAGFPGAAELRQTLMTAETGAELEKLLKEWTDKH